MTYNFTIDAYPHRHMTPLRIIGGLLRQLRQSHGRGSAKQRHLAALLRAWLSLAFGDGCDFYVCHTPETYTA
jgi:hypothetical protein